MFHINIFKKIIMGTNPTTYAGSPIYNPLFLNSLEKLKGCSIFAVWKSRHGSLYEQYKVFCFSTQQLKKELNIFELRNHQNSNIVKVHYVQILNDEHSNSGYRQLKVFTQRIPYTLNLFSKIELQKGLSILNEAAQGFQYLYKHAGYFQIDDSLIGFNTNSQIRVWINSNWSLNSKIVSKNSVPEVNMEHFMVLKLIETVQARIESSPLQQYFSRKRRQVKNWTFLQLKQFIYNFAMDRQLILTSQVDLTLGRFQLNQRSVSTTPINLKTYNRSPKFTNLSSSLGGSIENNDAIFRFRKQFKQQKKYNRVVDAAGYKKNLFQNLSFKNRHENDIILKNQELQSLNSNRLSIQRERKQKKSISVFPSSNPKGHKRLSIHELQIEKIENSAQNLITFKDNRFRLTVSNAPSLDTKNNNSSLEKLRVDLKQYIEFKEDKQLRESCPHLEFKHKNQLNLLLEETEKRQLQFKPEGIKRAKRISMHIRSDSIYQTTEQRHQKRRFFSKNVKSNQKQAFSSNSLQSFPKSISQFKLQKNIQFKNTRSQNYIQSQLNVCLLSNVPRLNTFQSIYIDKQTQQQITSLQSIDNSMLTKTATKDDKSTTTRFSKTKQLKGSQIILQDNEEGYVSQKNLQNRFTRLNGLQLKNTLTQSINIPSTKSKFEEKENQQGDGKKQLSMLDLMVIKRNLRKQNKNETGLDISMELTDDLPQILHKSIIELDEQCD